MTPEDLARIHAACFPERPWSASELSALLAHSGALCCSHPPYGFALARQTLDEAELLTIAVVPEARSNGHGRALLSEVCDLLARSGAKRLFLEVADDNSPATRLYESFGFERVGLRRAYYPRPGAPAANALILERILA